MSPEVIEINIISTEDYLRNNLTLLEAVDSILMYRMAKSVA